MQREPRYRAYDKRTKFMTDIQGFRYTGDKHIQVYYLDADGDSATCTCEKQYIELLQYTGINDKNGKEIYEGYIVKCEKRGYAFYRSVVKYNDELARFDVYTGDCAFPMTLEEVVDDISITGADYEVIGNIYES